MHDRGGRHTPRRNASLRGSRRLWLRSDDVFSLGVADGVYMWATQGIDAGEFSRSLMQTAKSTVEAGDTADVLNGTRPPGSALLPPDPRAVC